MDFRNVSGLRYNGFGGFISIKELWSDPSTIPKKPGVYMVLNPDFENAGFIHPGAGGFYKNRDPNVSEDVLWRNHVPGALVVYIGKAGGSANKTHLRERIGAYLRFVNPKGSGHYGGRYIWQLENYQDLVFCWKETPGEEPRDAEIQLLLDFQLEYGKKPFANLMG